MTNWTTQEYGVASPTALYLRLEHKEANKRLIFSQMDAIHLQKMKTMLEYVHTKGGMFLPRVEEGGI